MLIQTTFSYNDARNVINISKYVFNIIRLNHREVATLPSSRYHQSPGFGITL